MSGQKMPLAVTPAQTRYLLELVRDDMDQSELTPTERQQAAALRRKLTVLEKRWTAWGL